jgi:hypothetical protein
LAIGDCRRVAKAAAYSAIRNPQSAMGWVSLKICLI